MSGAPRPILAAEDRKKGLVPLRVIYDHPGRIYSELQIESMCDQLKRCYTMLKQEYDEMVADELSTDYILATDGENVFRGELLSRNFVPSALKFDDLPITNRESTQLSDIFPKVDEYGQNVISKVQCTVIVPGKTNPPINFWQPISSNITTEEKTRLTHFPLLDNNVDEACLYEELRKLYPDGVHGVVENWERTEMSDWLLYKLMRTMLEESDVARHPDLFYYCIYIIWPNKWSQRQLSNGYPRLCAQFAEDDYNPESAEPWKPKVEQKVAATLGTRAVPVQFPEGDYLKVAIPLPNDRDLVHCSVECWKKFDFKKAAEALKASDEEQQSYEVIAYIGKKSAATAYANEGWIAAMFGIGTHASFCQFVKDYVNLADRNHRFRTCQQVYEYILHLVDRPSSTRIDVNKSTKRLDAKTRQKHFQANMNRIIENNQDKNKPFHLILPLIACRHFGPCGLDEKDCKCSKHGVCSHLCSCDVNCKMRFPGCNCRAGQCKTKVCQCVFARWECNPLTCESCKCEDPVAPDECCSNCPITRNLSKKVYIAESEISGNGLFIKETAEKNEFIMEYVGERITHAEAERRGALYDLKGCSYLFDLLSGGAIDSTRAGNETRFVNHSINPNCFPASRIVNGEERIGIFAKTKLMPGTELTIDYLYSKEHQQVFKKTTTKRK